MGQVATRRHAHRPRPTGNQQRCRRARRHHLAQQRQRLARRHAPAQQHLAADDDVIFDSYGAAVDTTYRNQLRLIARRAHVPTHLRGIRHHTQHMPRAQPAAHRTQATARPDADGSLRAMRLCATSHRARGMDDAHHDRRRGMMHACAKCGASTTNPGRCTACKPKATREQNRRKRERPSTYSTVYSTARWRDLREYVLRRDKGTCQLCGERGTVAGHIQPFQGRPAIP